MPKFCGGINLNLETLKLIDGVICDVDAKSVDVNKAISNCGQLWDGNLFKAVVVDGYKIITLHGANGESIGTPVLSKGNCGVGLDGRFFKVVKGKVELQDGFLLTVEAIPKDSEIWVSDANSERVSPINGSTNMFLLDGLGDTYTVQVSHSGYASQIKEVVNDKDQIISVELVKSN